MRKQDPKKRRILDEILRIPKNTEKLFFYLWSFNCTHPGEKVIAVREG
jgi:hypothetical protein